MQKQVEDENLRDEEEEEEETRSFQGFQFVEFDFRFLSVPPIVVC